MYHEWGIVLNVARITSSGLYADHLLLRDQYLLIVLMSNAEGFPLSLHFLTTVNISSRGRVFLHVALHPRRVLSLSSEAEACTLGRVGFEAAVKTVGRLSGVLWIAVESIGLGHAIRHNGFLQGAGALLFEDA